MARNTQLLVWGANKDDPAPLFAAASGIGPSAGEFRVAVRDRLHAYFAGKGTEVFFSEDGEKYGHHPENPGLYEPRQLRAAELVLLLFPARRAMAVNTWELALACETSRSTRRPLHEGKLAFVVPQSLYEYLCEAMNHKVTDPANFEWPIAGAEPVLGPHNSFAARWIYRLAPKNFAAAGGIGDPGSVVPMIFYDDSTPWKLHSEDGARVLDNICFFAIAHVPM